MLEILFVAAVFLPYVAIGRTLHMCKKFLTRRGWRLPATVLKVIGYPFSIYDDVY